MTVRAGWVACLVGAWACRSGVDPSVTGIASAPVTDASAVDASAQFSILWRGDAGSTAEWGTARCIATLIGDGLLLTARHCVAQTPRRPLVVCGKSRFGPSLDARRLAVSNARRPEADRSPHAVAFILVPPRHDDVCDGDVALLVLREPIRGVHPIDPELSQTPWVGQALRPLPSSQHVRPQRPKRILCAGAPACGAMMGASELLTTARMCGGESGSALLNARGAIVGVLSRSGPDCGQAIFTGLQRWAGLLRMAAVRAARALRTPLPRWAR